MAQPNIYDIARTTGVSITTVSHALTGRGRVAAATRDRILQAAAEIGYTGNPHARSLVSGRSRTIAIQVAGFTSSASSSSLLPDAAYYMELLNGAAVAAASHEYAIMLATYDFSPRRNQQVGLDGAIIVDPAGGESLATEILERGLPVVTTGRPTRGDVRCPWVDNDHGDTAIRVLRHFSKRGYRRPALVATSPTRSYVADIIDAYRRWCDQCGIEPQIVELGEPPTESAAARATRKLLQGSDPPDAILATYDRLAMGVLLQAERMRLDVPGDLGLASAVDSDLLRRVSPAVTGVANNARLIGKLAVEALIRQLVDPEAPWSGIVVPNRIIARASTARDRAPETGGRE
ncbi:MAG TPA: LacI family DNA-binding transcriptional regulator [Solirubrobacteraceae bacterium]|jgi:DNA-binding LacI/PurR family transcriptional regulator